MERATKVGFVNILIPCRPVRLLAVLSLLAVLPASAYAKADFLIVEEVRPLLIYNQYQQQISSLEKEGFLPFTPFRILEANDLLGDGFTPCMRVEFNNRIFFFEKDTSGQLTGSAGIGFSKAYRNTSIAGDTIEVLKNNGIIFANPPQTHKSPIAQGTRVVRLFSHQGLTYVRILGSGSRFGWIRFVDADKGRDWKISKEIGVSIADRLEKALPLIHLKVNEVNETLSQLYDYFNRESPRRRQAPRWKVEETGSSVVCMLESETPRERFSESSRALAKSIEGVLLGAGLSVVSVPGRIEIGRGGGR